MRLEALPQEVIVEIVSHMSAESLTKFARTSKFFNHFVQLRLWTTIELHHASFHESERRCFVRQRPPDFNPRKLFYSKKTRVGILKGNRLLQLLKPSSPGSQHLDHPEHLASRIRSLSMVVQGDPDIEAWNVIPHLISLEYLEVHGCYTWHSRDYLYQDSECLLREQLDMSLAHCPNIRHITLYGYVPRCFAAWALRFSARLERVELGMLEGAIDVHDPHMDARYPWEPRRDATRKLYDFYPSAMINTRHQTWHPIPRPLRSFLPSEVWEEKSQELELQLPRLKHVHLCQTCRGDDAIAADELYYWSSRSEEAAHKSWRQILLACGSTLETLVLEQRIGVLYHKKNSEKGIFEEPDKVGIGSAKLLHWVEQLLAKAHKFPALKHVQLRGIFVHSNDHGQPLAGSPIGDFMMSMKERGITCEARRGRIGWFDGDDGGTRWDAFRKDHEREDKETAEKYGRDPWIDLDSEEVLASV